MTINRPHPTFHRMHLVFLGLYLTFYISQQLLDRSGPATGPAASWRSVGWYALLAAVGAHTFRDAFARSIRLTRQRPWRTVLWLAVAYFASDAAPLIPTLLLGTLGWTPTTMLNEEAVAAFASALPAGVYLVTVAILGPMTEELVYREALIQRLGVRVPRWVALLVSSALFGLLHIRSVAEPPLVLLYGSIGLTFGLVLMATRGNLLVVVIAHGLHNGVPALAQMLTQ